MARQEAAAAWRQIHERGRALTQARLERDLVSDCNSRYPSLVCVTIESPLQQQAQRCGMHRTTDQEVEASLEELGETTIQVGEWGSMGSSRR